MEKTSRIRFRRSTHGRVLVFCCLALILVGAKKSLVVRTRPAGSFIKINGENRGEAPVSIRLDFKRTPLYRIVASREGYYDTAIDITKSDRRVKQREVMLVLQEDAAWQMTAHSEATNRWLRIQVHPDMDDERAWQILVDGITSD